MTGVKEDSGEITVNHRQIPYRAKTDRIIYFDFYALCSGPRSQRDYMMLADGFQTVLIDQVPQFEGERIISVISGVEDDYQR